MISYGHEAISTDCESAEDGVCDRPFLEDEGHLGNTGHEELRVKKLPEGFVLVLTGIS